VTHNGPHLTGTWSGWSRLLIPLAEHHDALP
jgi:hypothetical protein